MSSFLQSQSSPRSPGPVPSSNMIPSPSCGGSNSAGPAVEHLHFYLAYNPPGSYSNSNNSMNEDGRVSNCQVPDHQVPDPSRIIPVYHPKLDGKPIFFKYTLTLTFSLVGQICDEGGNDIPLDAPPPSRHPDKGPDDWAPYDNCLQFEVTDFLFCRNQMSAGDINFLLSLWAASLTMHDDEPPFLKAMHVYDTIDSTPLSDVTWESFSLQYNGTRPAEGVLSGRV